MIARAETLDGKIVEGYYMSPNKYQTFIREFCANSMVYQVDDKTVEYKIGDEWYSMDELTNIVLNGS